MSKKIFLKIKDLLEKNNVEFQTFEHEPVYTSEQAAKIREKKFGISAKKILRRGAKAMILRISGGYYQLIISASKKIDFKKVKDIFGSRPKFASSEEVKEITDCVPGSVPPFGNLFNIPVYVDPSLLENEYIDFNAGELTRSIIMKSKDWKKIVKPIIKEFS